VRQLDNDVEAVYGLLEGITETQHKHSTALADLGVTVTSIRATQQRQYNRLDEMDAHVEGLQTALADVGATLKRHGSRLDTFDTRFDGLDARFDGLDARFDDLSTKLDRVLDRLASPELGEGSQTGG
jgi:chromosome segregation ATPase